MYETLARTADGRHWITYSQHDDTVRVALRGGVSPNSELVIDRARFHAILAHLHRAPERALGLDATYTQADEHAVLIVGLRADGTLALRRIVHVRDNVRVEHGELPAQLTDAALRRLTAFLPED